MLSHLTTCTQYRCLVNAVDGSLKEETPEIDVFKLKKYTELFRNIASYKIMPVNSPQIGDITKTVKLPKIMFHSLFVSMIMFMAKLVNSNFVLPFKSIFLLVY